MGIQRQVLRHTQQKSNNGVGGRNWVRQNNTGKHDVLLGSKFKA